MTESGNLRFKIIPYLLIIDIERILMEYCIVVSYQNRWKYMFTNCCNTDQRDIELDKHAIKRTPASDVQTI